MRLLANENFPLASVRSLRAAGHDVAAIIEDTPGTTDAEVLAQAAREARIVLTIRPGLWGADLSPEIAWPQRRDLSALRPDNASRTRRACPGLAQSSRSHAGG